MKILVHDYSGHPFQIQLSRYLSEHEHEVQHVYSGSFQTPKGNLKNRDNEKLTIRELRLKKTFKKYSYIQRYFQEIEYGKLMQKVIDDYSPDVVISGNTPLDAQRLIVKKCNKEKIPCIFWVQDIYSIAIEKILSSKYLGIGKFISLYYKRIERNLYEMSDGIIAITEDFTSYIRPYMEKGKKLQVIENWAPLEEVHVLDKDNPWARKHKLEDKTNFIYSGTLGMKHNPNLLLELALRYKENDDIRIVIVSEGLGADWLTEKKNELNLNNLIILNFQLFERMSEVLATADVLIAVLEKEAGLFSVPSKVLTYLCARRPILLSVPIENLSARLIAENNAGLVTDANDIDGFVKNADKLIMESEYRVELGLNGRRYAEEKFNIEKIAGKFSNIIDEVTLNKADNKITIKELCESEEL